MSAGSGIVHSERTAYVIDGAVHVGTEAILDDACKAWREQRYPMVAGDPEFIPLPEGQRQTLRIDRY